MSLRGVLAGRDVAVLSERGADLTQGPSWVA